MTIADAEQNRETKYVVTSHVVWPKDKDGNIIWPEWAKDKSGPRATDKWSLAGIMAFTGGSLSATTSALTGRIESSFDTSRLES